MPSQPRRNRVRHGLTLIELLVVVSILLIVTVIAVPALKPALENRKIREAARALNVYLGSARNHAIELGRPVGVLFNRDSTQGNPCLTLQQVEIPAPYAGDTTNSAAVVYVSDRSPSPNGTTYTVQIAFNPPVNADLFDGGDYIQFGYQGLLYTIADDPAPTASSATATITLPPNYAIPWPTTAPGIPVPFQITIQPDDDTLPAPSAASPLQLPVGTVIDLQASGWQTPGTGFNPNLWFGRGRTTRRSCSSHRPAACMGSMPTPRWFNSSTRSISLLAGGTGCSRWTLRAM